MEGGGCVEVEVGNIVKDDGIPSLDGRRVDVNV